MQLRFENIQLEYSAIFMIHFLHKKGVALYIGSCFEEVKIHTVSVTGSAEVFFFF